MIKQSPPWVEAIPDQRRFAPLPHNASADVVVIGGGIVGVTAAWQLAQAGKSVILLEKHHIGGGDTGFTTALLTRIPDTSLAEYAQRAGRKRLATVLHTAAGAQESLRRLIYTESIDCDFVEQSSYIVSFQEHDEVLEREWAALKTADADASRLIGQAANQLGGGIKQAIRVGGEGQFHIRKFIFGLLQTPIGKRIQVYEETAASGYTVHAGLVEISTAHGTVSASRVIVATGWPMPQTQAFRQQLKPQSTYVIAAESNGPVAVPAGQLWDTANPYHYLRRIDGQSIIVGGADEAPGATASIDRATAKLGLFLGHHWPGEWRLTHRWSGTIFSTPDGLPIIDADPATNGRVVVATGLSGNGMVMGYMAAQLAVARVLQQPATPAQALFSLNRFHNTTRATPTQPRPLLGWSFIALVLVLAYVLGRVFLDERGGWSFFRDLTFQQLSNGLFPLVGLYAFFLLWVQVMLGSFMPLLKPRIPWILQFHRAEGVFALLFALLHPTLLFIGEGSSNYFAKNFVDPSLTGFVWLGQIQLFLLVVTVATAKLRQLGWLSRHWRVIHLMNYAIFAMAWVHSWQLGSDVGSRLSWLWFGMALTAAAGFGYRMIDRVKKRRQSGTKATKNEVPVATPVEAFVRVAAVSDVQPGQPFCATVNGKPIMLLQVGDEYFAIDNTCSHAGGPLCEGRLQGKTIECPWHQSQFNIETGTVVTGPAIEPQARYDVRVEGDGIEIRRA